MIRRFSLAMLATVLAPALHAQLVFTVVDRGVETTVNSGSVYTMRAVEPGTRSSILLRLRNTGNVPVDVTQFSAVGAGFSFDRPLPPRTLQKNEILNGTLFFSAGDPANYNATVRMNSTTLTVMVTVLNGAALDVSMPCTRAAGTDTISFGNANVGNRVQCDVTLRNPGTQDLAISTMGVTGPGFSAVGVTTPLTLAAGAAIVFPLQLDVQASGSIAGVLTINARQYALTAIGVDPPVPPPILDWESAAFTSGQQRKLTVRLPEPSPTNVSGTLTLSFQSNVALAADDPTVMFLETSGRQVRFAVEKGKTEVTLNNGSFVTFQTGTTAGTIRFAFAGPPQGFGADPSVSIVVPPAQIALDAVTATRIQGALRFDVTGFDNTFSMGSMLFRFYDASGQQITAAIPADFTAAFRSFFTQARSGSTFRARIQFPVSGDSLGIAAMEADLSSAAGTVRTGRLTF